MPASIVQSAPPAPLPLPADDPGVLDALGIVGFDAVEPVILAALVAAEPLLLIGRHGTGKSYLLVRLAEALGLRHAHYNAAILNFDDLLGYPLPDGAGGLEYARTPGAIWGVEAVFFDEISRCRPDMQNKLFPIVHERRVQGLLLETLMHRWAAMNPPALDDDSSAQYVGSEPLDPALADRFLFVVPVPDWTALPEHDQERIVLAGSDPIDPAAATRLRRILDDARRVLPTIRASYAPRLASYTRVLCGLLRRSEVDLSPRRAGMLLRGACAVHALRQALDPGAALDESVLLAVLHGLPQPATGGEVKSVTILTAHREAWAIAGLAADDPRRLLLADPDPVRRVVRAAGIASIDSADFSALTADALAQIAPGGRHALATFLFASGAAGRLIAAVAEQAAQLYALVETPQDVHESVPSRGPRHETWQRVVAVLAELDPAVPETARLTNLLAGLFGAGELSRPDDVDRVAAVWQAVRATIGGDR